MLLYKNYCNQSVFQNLLTKIKILYLYFINIKANINKS